MTDSLLIVDDDPHFRETARALLGQEGFTVVAEAATGAEALVVAVRDRPAIVLLDIRLPDLDGFEVAERLAALDEPPIIVLTSSRDPSDFGTLIAKSAARGFVGKADLSGPALSAIAALR